MNSARKSLAVLAGSGVILAFTAGSAGAQTPVDPSVTPVENQAGLGPITPFGLHISLALLLGLMGLLIVMSFVIAYMRYAPRFAKDEESLRVVRADRVKLGRELPRRNVDLSQAAPVVVAPPAIPAALGAASGPVAAGVAAPATPSAPIAPAVAAVAPAPAAAEAPAAAPVEAAAVPATTPAAAPAVPAERTEVTMDQAVYEQTLQELLASGTDRRIAEGKAKRTGMIAAKKAAGEG